MHILFINQTLGMGGAEIFDRDLLVWLKSQGHTIDAWVALPAFARLLEKEGIKVSRIPFVIDIIGNWKGLLKGLLLFVPSFLFYGWIIFINKRNGSNAFLTGFNEKLISAPWLKLFNYKICWLEFSPLNSLRSKFNNLPLRLYVFLSGHIDRIIVPSLNTRKSLITSALIQGCNISVISLARKTLMKSKSRKKSSSVVCISRLEQGKGQDLLLQAWPKVTKQVPNAHLYIIGEGDFLSKLQSIVEMLHLQSSVSFIGSVDNSTALSWMASASLVAFPSVWPLEGFGLVSIEAMSQAKAIVGFKSGPLPEIVTPDTGILVPPYNTTALAKAIVKLLTHPELAEKLGRQGRKKFLSRYTFTHVGPKYEKAFLEAFS